MKRMEPRTLLIYCTHGTYGRDDDAYGALLQANTALAKGMRVTLVLVEDGVLMSKKEQNPAKIGAVNNLVELRDFLDLGGTLLALQESLDERGLSKNDLIEGMRCIQYPDLVGTIEDHQLSLTF
jgi:sulfur relay (sulfurtransferase) DsrF/TusC family protein